MRTITIQADKVHTKLSLVGSQILDRADGAGQTDPDAVNSASLPVGREPVSDFTHVWIGSGAANGGSDAVRNLGGNTYLDHDLGVRR